MPHTPSPLSKTFTVNHHSKRTEPLAHHNGRHRRICHQKSPLTKNGVEEENPYHRRMPPRASPSLFSDITSAQYFGQSLLFFDLINDGKLMVIGHIHVQRVDQVLCWQDIISNAFNLEDKVHCEKENSVVDSAWPRSLNRLAEVLRTLQEAF
ncbi:hypothetical protein RIF29_30116 [Crotalaria pallida]|uniref:Uncharacterized protein n=1 Tax=Crotalaria pallida TaxID=3830 RepID=A0AAN9EG07_CROPI